MRRTLVLAMLAVIWLPGAETAPPPAQTPATTAATPPPPPRDDSGLAKLRDALPKAAWVVERDNRIWWQFDAATALPIVAIDDDRQPQVEIAGITVSVMRRFIESERKDAQTALHALAPTGKAAGLVGLTLAEGPLTGIHLRNAEAVVLPEGVLRKEEIPAGNRSAEIAHIKETVEALVAALPKLDMDETTRRAMADFLGKLTEQERKGDLDDIDPAFARRLVRSGWLRQFFTTISTDEAVEQAVRDAERMQPTLRFTAAGCQVAEVRDAFSHGGWMIRTPKRSALLVDHLLPIYYQPYPTLKVVAELPAGTDPLDPPVAPTALHLWRLADGAWERIASADAGKPLVECESGAWRRAVPARTRGNLVGGWMPPHLVASNLHGDVLALVTAQGWLVPPHDGSRAEGERFLTESVRQLPDAAHLDLVGQYLMQYVYDSPDPRRPTLVGDKQNKGDIHQTAYETMANVSGGMMRGDCDDAAELYQTIAERQGRTAHVLSLPAHAACAWAERQGDIWKVILLQTGPAYEFTDGDLKQALAKTYKHFDESDTFDPNGLGLLLRFDNENLRGSWRLSYRIFEDPEYARIMIDVQKDWHYQTYARGIAKMQKLIASGKREAEETANFRELSGLYSFTGQYALAAEFHQKAIELTRDDPLSALYMRIELIGHLFDAGKDRLARDEAIELIERTIPANRKRLGLALMQLGAQLGNVLAEHNTRDLAVRALRPALDLLDERMAETLGRKGGQKPGKGEAGNTLAGMTALGDWLEGPDFDAKMWENHPTLEQFRRLSQMLVGSCIRTLEGATPADIAADPGLQQMARTVQIWLDHIAFRDIDDAGEVLFRFASAGRAYETLLGSERFAALVDAAPRPAPAKVDPAHRVGGIAQVAIDAGWLKLSVPFWSGKMFELFAREKASVDVAAARSFAKKTIEAADAITGSELELPHLAHQAHIARIILALIDKDEKALRERLRLVKNLNDKTWRDDTAQWLGDAARAVPLDWYPTVLKCWDEEVGYKPKYFWIAWRAALNKAPRHALLAAEAACRRYPDDANFAEELAFMRQVPFIREAIEPKH